MRPHGPRVFHLPGSRRLSRSPAGLESSWNAWMELPCCTARRRRPWLIAANAGLLARLHLDVHARSDTGLPPFRDWLESYIRRATGLDEDVRLRALRRLERLKDGTSLCHGDFHPDNVVMTGRGPVIIDWATAATGPPEADVARTIMLLESGEPIASGLERLAIAVGRRVFLALYLRAYFKSSSLTRREVDPWMLPIAVALLRGAGS